MKDDVLVATSATIGSIIAYFITSDFKISVSYLMGTWTTVLLLRIFGGKS